MSRYLVTSEVVAIHEAVVEAEDEDPGLVEQELARRVRLRVGLAHREPTAQIRRHVALVAVLHAVPVQRRAVGRDAVPAAHLALVGALARRDADVVAEVVVHRQRRL